MSSVKILLVSDKKKSRDIFLQAFRCERAYQLFCTANPEEAVTLINKKNIFVVLCEYDLDTLKGPEFLEIVKRNKPETIRFLVAPQSVKDEVYNAFQNEIIYSCFQPPCVPEIIRQTIKQAVRHRRILTQNRLLKEKYRQISQQRKNIIEQTVNLENQKKRFMLIANHELRTPLTLISTALQLLEPQLPSSSAVQHRLMATAREGVRRLTDILEKISLVLANNLSAERERMNLLHLLETVKNKYQTRLQQRRITVRLKIPNDIFLFGNREQLDFLFSNLLSNAVKFTPDGGTVNISSVWSNLSCIISFADNGIGMAAKELNNVFKPFYQIGLLRNHYSSPYKFKGNGSGLGLTVCKKIVEAHEGEIWIESEGPNSGSTVYIKIPANSLPYQKGAAENRFDESGDLTFLTDFERKPESSCSAIGEDGR